jgi:predicted transcriptional regulator of viral defense system
VARSRQDLRRRLEGLAFNQAGYFTAAQALETGYSYQAQKYHVDAGNWVRIDRGLFRLPAWPSRIDDQFVLWTLWSGGKGVISHESALQVHELSDVDPASIHLTVPPGCQAADPMVVTHVATLPTGDVESREAWSVTTPLRTLADAAAGDLSQEHIDQAVADAIQRGLFNERTLLRRTADLPDRPALRLERAIAKTGGTHA